MENRFEIVISGRVPYDRKQIEAIHLTDDIIYPVAESSSHILRTDISLEKLCKEPLIVREKGSAARYNTMESLIKKGFRPKVLVESGSTDFIKELVREKKGYTFLPWFCITEELAKGEFKVIPIPELELKLPIDIMYVKGRELSGVTVDFIAFLKRIKRPLLTETLEHLERLEI
jgi:DNA-binding transcriptional LysR family regulator